MLDSTLIKNESVDDHVDDHVDQEIQDCFSVENPKCFFVFAGAGSGKTRSLISILTFLDKERGESLRFSREKSNIHLKSENVATICILEMLVQFRSFTVLF